MFVMPTAHIYQLEQILWFWGCAQHSNLFEKIWTEYCFSANGAIMIITLFLTWPDSYHWICQMPQKNGKINFFRCWYRLSDCFAVVSTFFSHTSKVFGYHRSTIPKNMKKPKCPVMPIWWYTVNKSLWMTISQSSAYSNSIKDMNRIVSFRPIRYNDYTVVSNVFDSHWIQCL
jgi:hypothetical protein